MPTPRDPDERLGRDHFDRLVRGDAMIGLIADVPAFEAAMVEALWAAGRRGSGSAFITLGECYAAAVGFGPIGAFDGVPAGGAADREWSPAARAITDEGDEGVEAALRCFAEAACLGAREAAMRFAKGARGSSQENHVEALRLLQALAQPTPAELYQRGLVQHWLGDLEASCASHTAAAAAGDADAMFELHLYYGQGLGVAPDAAASRRWLERAAEAGQARALYNLGAAWASGRHGAGGRLLPAGRGPRERAGGGDAGGDDAHRGARPRRRAGRSLARSRGGARLPGVGDAGVAGALGPTRPLSPGERRGG